METDFYNPNFWKSGFKLKKPVRSLKQALRYPFPKRLTLDCNPRIHAWLWWNF